MIPNWNVPQIDFDEVMEKYVAAGRELTSHTLNDIQIIAGAIAARATLLTREDAILKLFPSPIAESW